MIQKKQNKANETMIKSNLLNHWQVESALKMAILDAIQKGHTNVSELTAYLSSDVCKNATISYMNMMQK